MNRKLARVVIVAVVAMSIRLVGVSTPTWAQSSDGTPPDGTTIEQLVNRIDRLQRDIRTLHMQLAAGRTDAPTSLSTPATPSAGAPSASSDATPPPAGTGTDRYTLSRFDERISALEDEMRQQTGANETLSYKVDQLTQRLDKLVADVDFRLSSLEGRVSGSASSAQPLTQGAPPPGKVVRGDTMPAVGAPARALGTITQSELDKSVKQSENNQVGTPPVSAPPPTSGQAAVSEAILPPGDAKSQYKYVFGLLSDGKYDTAETALKAFIDHNGKDPLVDNARYWLGETYYVRAQYVPAAKAFLEAYQKAPKGPKAPDSLLKLGMSLGNLDKKAEACAAFSKVKSAYPKMRAPIAATLKREETHYGCSK